MQKDFYSANDLIFFNKTLKAQGVIRQQKAVRAFISKYKVMSRIYKKVIFSKEKSLLAMPQKSFTSLLENLYCFKNGIKAYNKNERYILQLRNWQK